MKVWYNCLDKFATTNTSIMDGVQPAQNTPQITLGLRWENHLCTSNVPPPPSMSDTGDTGMMDTGSEPASEPATEPSDEPTDAVVPGVGDIIFTEIMLDTKGIVDSVGEWIELTNLTDERLDLTGFAIQDDGRNFFQIPDGTMVEPNDRLIVGRSNDTSANGGVEVDVVSEGLSLANKVFVLGATQDDVQENFEEMVVVGTSGSGIEMGLEAAKVALSEPLLSTDNQGFLREANLSLIFISDEDDFSPIRHIPICDTLRI